MTTTYADSDAIVEAKDLGYTVGSAELVSNVSLRLAPGELVAFVGPNGAGKSTMLRLIAGDIKPSTGEVLVGGKSPDDWNSGELATWRAVMEQDSSTVFAYTVRELVKMGRAPHPKSDDDEPLVDQAMAAGEVTHLAHRDSTTLSGGELARASFGRALAQTPKLLLLDEPTAALDLRYQERVMQTARLLADDGACVIVVVHDLNLAARFADRVVMFAHGSVAAQGLPADVLVPETITPVYRQNVQILAHPVTGTPLVVPV